jgi:two-component system, sporulation sensor kinase E
MYGWLFQYHLFATLMPAIMALRFNTALCFVLLSAALLLTQYPGRWFSKPGILVFGSLAMLIGLITMCEYSFHTSTRFDQLFVADPTPISAFASSPGRMAYCSAVNFALLGLGLLLVKSKTLNIKRLAQGCFHAATALSVIALIGYLYGVSSFYWLFYGLSMAKSTALLFILLSVAAALINPAIGLTRLFSGKQVGNQMARRLFILILLMVVIFGSLRLQPYYGAAVSMQTGVSVLAATFLLVCLVLIWNTANWLNKIDAKRSEAEAEVRLMNINLEKRVEERSGELLALLDRLKESEEKYRSLIEHASDAIYVVDYDGNFLEVNASMGKMTGYSKEELMELNIQQIIDPENLKVNPFGLSFETDDQSRMKERHLIHKNGNIFEAELNIKRFPDNRILVIARDITYRKKMETELREAELKFRTIAEKSMVGIYIIQKNKYAYVNPRFAQVFGYEPHEMIDSFDVEQVLDESYQALAAENVRKRMEGEVESIHYEAKGRHRNGSSNWIEFYGSRVTFGHETTIMGTMIDITERKKAEEILTRSEANLQTMLKITDTAYALFDRKLKVEAFNQSAIQFVKEQFNHIPSKGDSLADYFPQHRFPQFSQYTEEVLQGKNISYEIDYPQADGTVKWFFIRLFPITNDNKEILGMMMALDDITERKNATENLKSAYQSIQDHIKNIKAMAWKQSHLMRRPLANLKALADILKDDPKDEVILNHIRTELESLDETINEMAGDASDYGNN